MLFRSGLADTDYTNIGVQLNIPLFQGGLTVSREREAAANRNAALAGLDAARRGAALAARQYYLGVTNGLAQVKALKAALISSQSALESNKLGYEVGVRINIDVLNAENQVYVTRRDLAKATLDTLMAQLRLKAATGALGEDDVAQINALLDPSNDTDGFTGNVVLKTAEGAGRFLADLLRSEVKRSLLAQLGALLMMPALQSLKRVVDIEGRGGAPLLGVNGVAVICHGRASARAITRAIQVAQDHVQSGLIEATKAAVSAHRFAEESASSDPENQPTGG